MDDGLLLRILQQEGLDNFTEILLVHDFSSLDDIREDPYPSVCNVFTCITIQDFWSASSSTLRYAESAVVQSYLGLLLAQHAKDFYGNKFSLLANELSETIQSEKGSTHFYNPEV